MRRAGDVGLLQKQKGSLADAEQNDIAELEKRFDGPMTKFRIDMGLF
jgi:hypothetical protein